MIDRDEYELRAEIARLRGDLAKKADELRGAKAANAKLRGEKALLAQDVSRLRRLLVGNCFYCGAPSRGSVCAAHDDLLNADDLAPTRAA